MTMTTLAPTSTVQLIQALDYAWSCIREANPDVPEVIIVTGRRRNKSEMKTLGYFCADTWKAASDEGRLAEVWISGERLSDGAIATMQTLLHEAVHALAAVRKIKDTSNRNRYHNREFAKLAREVGLEPPTESGGPAFGFSDCKITDETIFRYAEAIDRIGQTEVKVPRKGFDVTVKRPKKYALCGCGEKIPWTRANDKFSQQFGPITHSTCGDAFTPEDEL